MRILLVEDDKLIGDGIKAGLSKMGFSIDWFTAGLEGKNALYSAPYDAAILDLTLPGVDGLEILREWRDTGRRAPVLIPTASEAPGQRVQGPGHRDATATGARFTRGGGCLGGGRKRLDVRWLDFANDRVI